MRGLPAIARAVPASLSRLRPFRRRQPGRYVVVATRDESLVDLIEQLSPELLQRALTHSSWVGERIGSYERLEFLGDSVLGLAISSELYRRFPDREEGGLARLKAFVVSRASCEQVAADLGLATLVLERAPATERKRRDAVRSRSLLGDVLEALIGAVYLEQGFERARPAIVAAFEGQIRYAETAHVDSKTTLQELLAPRGLQPAYRIVAESGPAHARIFSSEVVVDGAVRGRGSGTTIKMSEQAAAQEALAALSETDLPAARGRDGQTASPSGGLDG